MIQDYKERHHPFEGCFNFRDIGGYPTENGQTVKWGKYFRAGRQDRMTSEDIARVADFQISTQIDLRTPLEVEEQGRGPMPELGADYHHIPVIPPGGTVTLSRLVGDTGISGKRYLGYLEFGPESWLKMFDIFANADQHPIIIHCTAGKDRTGVSTAFLLSVLGVNRELIEADYRLTNLDVERQVNFVEATVGLPEDMDRPSMMHAAGVPEEAITDFLDGLQDKYGGALGYLREIGVSEDTMDRVRSAFLE